MQRWIGIHFCPFTLLGKADICPIENTTTYNLEGKVLATFSHLPPYPKRILYYWCIHLSLILGFTFPYLRKQLKCNSVHLFKSRSMVAKDSQIILALEAKKSHRLSPRHCSKTVSAAILQYLDFAIWCSSTFYPLTEVTLTSIWPFSCHGYSTRYLLL